MSDRTRISKQPKYHSSRYERRRDQNNTFNSSRTVNELREENDQLIEVIKVSLHFPYLNSLSHLNSSIYIYIDNSSICMA